MIRAKYIARSRLQIRTVDRLKEARRSVATVSEFSLAKTAYNFTGSEESECQSQFLQNVAMGRDICDHQYRD